MVTSEEKMKVLRMIQEGKLTPEEGMALLDTLDEGASAEPAPSTTKDTGKQPGAAFNPMGRWFRVRVTDTRSGKTRANLRIPLTVVKAGMKMGMRFSPHIEGVEMDKFAEFIDAGNAGPIVDVLDDEDGEHVEVYIE